MLNSPRAIFFAGLIVTPIAGMCSAHAETIQVYDTGNFGELVQTLPGGNTKEVVYSYDVGTINPNDILVVDAEEEFTNGNGVDGSPAEIAGQIVLGDSPNATTGPFGDEGNEFKITVGMHHGMRIKGTIKALPRGNSDTFVNFVCWSDRNLKVEQDYGRLQILKITP